MHISLPYRVLSESVPWLCANGRLKEAEAIIKKAAKFNKVTVPDRIFTTHESEDMLPDGKASGKQKPGFIKDFKEKWRKRKQDQESGGAQYTVLDVIKHRRLFINAVVMCTLW